MFLSWRLNILDGSTDFDLPMFERLEDSTGVDDIEGAASKRSSIDDDALMS